MYQFSYAQVQRDSGAQAREAEAGLLSRIVEKLHGAAAEGSSIQARAEALHGMRQFWMALIEDLATPGNALPDALRASLISIGLSLLRDADRMDCGTSAGFAHLAEFNTHILAGLS